MELWSLKRHRCLVVDDLAEMRSMLRGMLEAYGAKDVRQARNGEEAIEILSSHRFDVVLCDYNLGDGKDGQQVLEEAKFRGILPYATVFLMVTAETTLEMVMGALEYEPDGYLSKPVTKTVLQRRLKRLLDRKEQLRAVSDALGEKDLVRALALCEEHLTKDPANRFELLRLKCQLLLDTGRYRDVEEICDGILAERDILWAALLLGKAYFHLGDLQEAKLTFEEIIEHRSTYVSAHDWLARTLEKLGQTREAQQVLTNAIKISPKSLLRQRALAEVALANEDVQASERARRHALRVGAHSVLKQPGDYAGLAALLAERDEGLEAMKVVESMRGEFSGRSDTAIEVALTEHRVLAAQGKEDEAAAALEAARALYAQTPSGVPSPAALALAGACLATGDGDGADEILGRVARNHADDETIVGRVRTLLADAGRESDGARIVEAAQNEVREVNERGMRLVREGKVDDAVALFTGAVGEMPRNPAVALNAAETLVLAMGERGVRRKRLAQAMSCLEVARERDPADPRCQRLLAECRRLAERRRSA